MVRTEAEKFWALIIEYFSESGANPLVEADEEEADEEAIQCAWTLVQLKNSEQFQSSDEEEDTNEKLAEQASKQNPKKRKKIVEVDDSEETLKLLLDWNRAKPEKPPREMVDRDAVGVCSELMRKQLMGSDVLGNQCRLMLVKNEMKKMMVRVFEETETIGTDGLEVPVYGKDGEVHEMVMKMWNKNTTPVLTSNVWNKFVAGYGLVKHSDFLSIWMFRHRETRKICFAVDYTRFDSVTKKLSPRISKTVFNRK